MSCRRQDGMSLLEVVVGMLLIGIGMAASISMLQSSMRNNVTALNKQNAIYLAQAIADKVRINSFAVDQYMEGNKGFSLSGWQYVEKSSSPACSICDSTAKENAYAQASADVNAWYNELQDKLPGAGFAIYAENRIRGQYAVEIRWPNRADLSRSETVDDQDTISMVFSL